MPAPAAAGSFCPPAIVSHCELDNTLGGEGCVLRHSTLRNVVLGSNAFIDAGCVLEDTILMGNRHEGALAAQFLRLWDMA